MLDIGGWEFLIVAFVLLMVVGPKELPTMLRGLTRGIRQVRSMAAEFSRNMQNMADEAELGDVKGTLEGVKRGNLAGIADAIDPAGNLKDSVEDLKNSTTETGLKGPEEDAGEEAEAIEDAPKAAKKPAAKKAAPKKAAAKKATAKKTSAKKAAKK